MSERENPFETPSPRGIRVVQATLRVVVAIQCFGYATQLLHLEETTPLLSLLQQGYEIAPEQFSGLSRYVAYALIVGGAVTLLRPMWFILIPLIVWQAGNAISPAIIDPSFLDILYPAIQSAGSVVPLSLLLIDFWPPRMNPSLTFCLSAVGLLRLATIATFVSHGVAVFYTFQNGGSDVEIVELCATKLFQHELAAEQAQYILAIVGITEIALAMSLLSSRNRLVAFLMVAWGILIASSHTIAFGKTGYHHTLTNFAMGGAPLAVLLFWIKAYQEQKPVILPEVSE